MQARKMTKLQKLITGSAAVNNIIAHLQAVLHAYGTEGFDLMLQMHRNEVSRGADMNIGLEYVKYNFLEANANKILEQFHEGMASAEARDAFVEIAEIFNGDPRFNQIMQHYQARNNGDSEDLRNFLLAEASCCILETCMTITNKKLFAQWKQASDAGERVRLKAIIERSNIMLANVRDAVENYKHPDARPTSKHKKISLRTKKINPMKMDQEDQQLLASLIQSHPHVNFFDVLDPGTGKPVKFLVPDPVKSGVFHHVKLTHSMVRYHRKKSAEDRFAVCHAAPLGDGCYGVVYESAASLSIKPGTKGQPDCAVVKKKKAEKARVVKHFKKDFYDADHVKREGEMLEKVMLLHAKHPVMDEEQNRGSIVMRKFNGKELIDHLIADWGDDHDVITKNTFTVDQRIALTIMVGEAIINQVHESGLIHRDIKGDNIMVELDAHNNPLSAVVIDYGLAKYNGEKTAENVGTSEPIDYRAPEVTADKPSSDEKSDAYSFATLLNQIIWYDVAHGQRYNDLTSKQKNVINEIVMRGMRSSKNERASMREMVNVFKEIFQTRGLTLNN